MTPAEAARVLAVAAIYDKRTIGEVEAVAWADALNDLDPRECAEAIRAHYGDSTDYLMPAHVRRRVAAFHRDAAQKRKDEATLRGIEEATLEHDQQRAHNHYLEASRLVAEARAAKAAREAEDADQSSEATA
jgi:hypothetical protein